MNEIYQRITGQFLEALKGGEIPWQKPWVNTPPYNLISQRAYRASNWVSLNFAAYKKGYPHNAWLTFRQALELGGGIRQGEKSRLVVFWKLYQPVGKETAELDPQKKIPFLRYSNVFNVAQTENIKFTTPQTPAKTEAAAIVTQAKLCPIKHNPFRAAYAPREDVIYMPPLGNFTHPNGYYYTLFHEMGHATGHASRLDREGMQGKHAFGSPVYAKEELIAEMTAAFLGHHAEISNDHFFTNSAGYLQNWIKALENDPKLILQASSGADKAANFILGHRELAPDADDHNQVPVPTLPVEEFKEKARQILEAPAQTKKTSWHP